MIAEPESEDREDADERNKRKRLERALDEALKSTFPASDPVSVEQPTPRSAVPDRVRIEISEVRARQGVTGHNVRYVLAFGIAGAIVALMMVIYLLN
jgi:hypothetical protein